MANPKTFDIDANKHFLNYGNLSALYKSCHRLLRFCTKDLWPCFSNRQDIRAIGRRNKVAVCNWLLPPGDSACPEHCTWGHSDSPVLAEFQSPDLSTISFMRNMFFLYLRQKILIHNRILAAALPDLRKQPCSCPSFNSTENLRSTDDSGII